MDKTLTLQPRLAAIAELIPADRPMADVGTDHAYLPVWLLLQRRIPRAIAADIVPGPLDRARQTAARYGVTERVDFRLCDGLARIRPEETDTVVIAGMGGETIAGILAAAPWTRRDKTLLLQPMSKGPELRRWLVEHGYVIRREKLVRDRGILYPILLAQGGQSPPPKPGQLTYGWAEADDPLFSDWLEELIGKTRWAVEGLERAEKRRDDARLEELRALLAALEEKRCTQ